jgi:hypothetical protein
VKLSVILSVDKLLISLKLEEHVSMFKDNGYNLLGAVVGLDDATLIGLGILLIGHHSLLV